MPRRAMHRSAPTLVTLLSALSSLQVFAAPAPSANSEAVVVDDALQTAERACRDLEFDLCAELATAIATDDSAADDVRVKAHVIAGTAHRVMGKDVEARLNFRFVLTRQPAFTLDAGSPPKITQFFELVRQEIADETKVAPTSSGRLTLESARRSFAVSVDGRAMGTTPVFEVDVEPGLHAIEFDVEGVPVRIEAIVYEGALTTVRLDPALSILTESERAAVDLSATPGDDGPNIVAWLVAGGTAFVVELAPGACVLSAAAALAAVDCTTLLGTPAMVVGGVVFASHLLAALVSSSALVGAYVAVANDARARAMERQTHHRVTVTPPVDKGNPRHALFRANADADDDERGTERPQSY